MVIGTKSHPRVTYLDTNNFYFWAIDAVYGSNLESVKWKCNRRFNSKNYQSDNLINNQQMWIDCLKPGSNKNECKCKRCGCIWSHSDAIDYFKELPFYNKSIKKPKIKCLKNIEQLAEVPFYEQLSVIKTNQAFRGYAMSQKVEIIEKKDPIVQLEASKLSIKNLFKDLLNEKKGFKYKITVKILLRKYKLSGEIEFAPVYFTEITDLN